jgi:MFS family permease
VFLLSLTMISASNGVLRTVVPSFISKRTSTNEQGSILGVIQSTSTIARVPGPLVAGPLYDLMLGAPFLLSVMLLVIAFGMGCRVLGACSRSNTDL